MIRLSFGSARRPCAHQTVCGDAFTIHHGDTAVTVALTDGLGHGPAAARASEAFCAFVQEHHDYGPEELIRQAHEHLRTTVGVAAVVLAVDTRDHSCTFCGVGNVDLKTLTRQPSSPLSKPGVVGGRLPHLVSCRFTLSHKDLLVLQTDGISSRYDLAAYRHMDPSTLASTLLENHGRRHDDATCVVFRVEEEGFIG